MEGYAVAAFAPGVRGDSYVDWTGRWLQELPELGRAAMAERRSFAARQDRRNPPPLIAQSCVADRIDGACPPSAGDAGFLPCN